jgi:hypothetical protein
MDDHEARLQEQCRRMPFGDNMGVYKALNMRSTLRGDKPSLPLSRQDPSLLGSVSGLTSGEAAYLLGVTLYGSIQPFVLERPWAEHEGSP